MTEDSRPPQVCPDRNNGTDQLVAHLAQTVAALSISRAKIRLLEASSFRVFKLRSTGSGQGGAN
jgi:hypothetical protein